MPHAAVDIMDRAREKAHDPFQCKYSLMPGWEVRDTRSLGCDQGFYLRTERQLGIR